MKFYKPLFIFWTCIEINNYLFSNLAYFFSFFQSKNVCIRFLMNTGEILEWRNKNTEYNRFFKPGARVTATERARFDRVLTCHCDLVLVWSLLLNTQNSIMTYDRSIIIHFIIKYLVFQIYSLKLTLLASNLHCAHKMSYGLKKSDFASIKKETGRKLFLCFVPIWFF